MEELWQAATKVPASLATQRWRPWGRSSWARGQTLQGRRGRRQRPEENEQKQESGLIPYAYTDLILIGRDICSHKKLKH